MYICRKCNEKVDYFECHSINMVSWEFREDYQYDEMLVGDSIHDKDKYYCPNCNTFITDDENEANDLLEGK